MKKSFIALLLCCTSISLFSQSWTMPGNAEKHKGEIVNMVGSISSIKYVTDSKNPFIVKILNPKDSNRSLSLILLKGLDENCIQDLKSTFLNQYVQVKGKIEINNGSPYIVINSLKQIAVAKEDFRKVQFWEPE